MGPEKLLQWLSEEIFLVRNNHKAKEQGANSVLPCLLFRKCEMLPSNQNFPFPQRCFNILLLRISMTIASDNRQPMKFNPMLRGHSH